MRQTECIYDHWLNVATVLYMTSVHTVQCSLCLYEICTYGTVYTVLYTRSVHTIQCVLCCIWYGVYMYLRLVVLCVHVPQVGGIVCTCTSGW